MVRKYCAKRLNEVVPITEDQVTKMLRVNEKVTAAQMYMLQCMPDVRIDRYEEVFCPYAACGARQSSLTIGIHMCRNSRCGRWFKVPDNATNRRIRKELQHDWS
ncbi:MAG: hypothetical protein RL292_364 [Candidatus Parcubacteria bacterium]|jgi:hypothetical protein